MPIEFRPSRSFILESQGDVFLNLIEQLELLLDFVIAATGTKQRHGKKELLHVGTAMAVL